MLISLVPATAITAAAATGAVSESAITVLKQLEGYSTNCVNKTFGYGTACPDGDKCDGKHDEGEANAALRAELKELDKAINAFAAKKGLSLTKGQHDALVLFSFQNGTAWTLGTGDLQFAVANRKTGADFLNAICYWNTSDSDARRMVEANMYLYGKYDAVAPDYFIKVTFDAKGGEMSERNVQLYDLNSSNAIGIIPTRKDWKFMGWFDKDINGTQVQTLTAKNDGKTLYALWQHDSMTADTAYQGTWVDYTVKLSALASQSLYRVPSGKDADIYTNENLAKMMETQKKDTIVIQKEYIDANGTRWGYISTEDFAHGTKYMRWVKLGQASFGGSSTVNGMSMDVMVTVTNTYVNSRSNASIFSNKNGTYNQGAKLRIINTANADGFVWGQVAKSADDATPVGWVALMYTDYDASKNQTNTQSGTAIATARIKYPGGYVNVRSGAGTGNQIVGALAHDLEVDLYETKFVNGIEWGRCNTGWFCLNYAVVTRLTANNGASSDAGFTSFAFTADLTTASDVFTTAGGTEKVTLESSFDGKNVVITNLTDVAGTVWGKIAEGWVNVDGNATLKNVKFYVVVDGVAVRSVPGYANARIDSLVKGVEFDVNELDIVDNVIWGKADKNNDDGTKTYVGWVDLSDKNVSRNGAPAVSGGNSYTGLIATVINTESVRVRETGATYGRVLGSLSLGTTAAVLAENNGWYKLDIEVDDDPATDSWVSGAYLNVREGTISDSQNNTAGTNGTAAPQTGKGVVANTYSGVNVRTGAGTAYAAINKLLPGTPVEILEVKTVGAAKWGRIAQGWVCMDYIAMVDIYPVGGTTGSSTTTSSQVAIYTGTVTETINVRKTTSLDADVVRQVKINEPITLHELITVVVEEKETVDDKNEGATVTTVKKTQYWARINDGYVYNPGKHLVLDTLEEETYTLANDVAKGSGTSFDLKAGEQVKVTKLEIENNYVKGFIECSKGTGWVKMTNMTKGFVNTTEPEVEETPNTNTGNNGNTGNTQPPVLGSTGNTTGGYADPNGYKYTGKVINTNSVNVRAAASTGANITTTLKNGAALVVYETVISDGMAWGRCDAGWVYLYYVDLTPTVNGAVDARVVYNDNTLIYSDMNMSSTTGSTYAKMAVIDIYEIVGKMARTDMGWVHTDNLL